MKAIIKIDVPDFQIGQEVNIHFKDSMVAKGVVEEENSLPSISTEKTGHWEMCEDADGLYGICSVCEVDADFRHYGIAYKWCPNCGAKMEVEE